MARTTILDGGMGQELIARTRSKPTPLWSARVMIDHPEIVREVHDDYFRAGAEIATTNTYSVLHDRLVPAGLDHRFRDLHSLACQMAVSARDAYGSGLVAGSLGPIGWSYVPELAPPWSVAAEIYEEIVRLHDPIVDLFLIETMSSVDQARGALAATAISGKPTWLGVTVDDDDGSRLRSGEAITGILDLVEEFFPKALLINCSKPEATTTAIGELAPKLESTRLGAYANGFAGIADAFKSAQGTADLLDVRTDLGPQRYADFASEWIALGAEIIGGCCEIGPNHIRVLADRFRSRERC